MAATPEKIAQELVTFLGMTLRPVGVKVLAALDGPPPSLPDKRRTFCGFVLEAAKGQDFLITMGDLDCLNAEISLGFRDPKFVNIEPRLKTRTQAIRIGPVEDADVVLLILNSEQVMTMAILLEGMTARFKGDMAVCGEGVAQVVLDGQPNVSFLCNGARLRGGGYGTNDIILSLPYKTLLELPDKMGKYKSLSRKAKAGLEQILLRFR